MYLPEIMHPRPNGDFYEMGRYRGPVRHRRLARATIPHQHQRQRRLKRAVDILLGCAALIFILPVLAVCCAAIKLDSSGPIFFYQMRTGLGGRRFKMYKLRTMVTNAEALKEKLQHLNKQSWPDFKIHDDPRITRVGKFLRRTSLDELPQIINVIKGDMSLVGPRPTSFSASTYSLWHTERLESKPGVTGLWQVLGRDEIDFDERVRLDIVYSRNQSLKLDFEIILKTFGTILGGRGAH